MKHLTVLLFIALSFSSCKKKEGCTNPLATNYDSEAEDNDGSCILPEEEPIAPFVGHWDTYQTQSCTQIGFSSAIDTSFIIYSDGSYYHQNALTPDNGTFTFTNTNIEFSGLVFASSNFMYEMSGDTLIITDQTNQCSGSTYSAYKYWLLPI